MSPPSKYKPPRYAFTKTEPLQLRFVDLAQYPSPLRATQTHGPTTSNSHSPTPPMFLPSKYKLPRYVFTKTEPRRLRFVDLAQSPSPLVRCSTPLTPRHQSLFPP